MGTSSNRRWVASFEKLLDDREKKRPKTSEKEFLNWALTIMPTFDGFQKIRCRGFQRLDRILDVDLEFEHTKGVVLFPADVPTFDDWVVIQVKRLVLL